MEDTTPKTGPAGNMALSWQLLWSVSIILAALAVLHTYALSAQTGAAVQWQAILGYWLANLAGWLLLGALFWQKLQPFDASAFFWTKGIVAILALSTFQWFLTTGIDKWYAAVATDPSKVLHCRNPWVVYASHVIDNLVLSVLLATYYHYRQAGAERLHRLTTAKALQDAKLESLRAQLHPHFLFNALHSVSALLGSNEEGQQLIANLSRLLRTMLHETRPLISLQEELAYVQLYLDMEKMRFGERLEVRRQVAPEVLQCAVPAFCLQPLVENWIKHALSKSLQPVLCTLHAYKTADNLVIELWDNGPGYKSPAGQAGLGIRHLKQRLSQIFGSGAGLSIDYPDTGGCLVTIQIPMVDAARTNTPFTGTMKDDQMARQFSRPEA